MSISRGKMIDELPRGWVDSAITPVLVLRMPAIRRNIATAIRVIGAVDRWRPHVKTHKCGEVGHTLLRAGVRHFKCATTLEYERVITWIREAEVRDATVVIANALRGPSLERAAVIANTHADIPVAVLAETLEDLEAIPESLGVMIDLNTGMDRTGAPMDDADPIVAMCEAAGERLWGLHAYDGHILDVDLDVRRTRAHAIYERVAAIARQAIDAGVEIGEVVTSGARTFVPAAEFGGLQALPGVTHRLSPGTIVLHDARTASMVQELDLEPGALVLGRVISHPRPGLVTVDTGSKAIAAEMGDPVASAIDWPHLTARRPSEEHLPLETGDGPVPARGEAMLLFPAHVCPTVNLASGAVVLEADGRVRSTTIDARGHHPA